MGKIDSLEIGEVDSHRDSANSFLLIKYARESQSIRFHPQREEAALECKEEIYHIICLSTFFLWASKGISCFFFWGFDICLLKYERWYLQGNGINICMQ